MPKNTDRRDTETKHTVAQTLAKRQSTHTITDTKNKRAQKKSGYHAYPNANAIVNHIAP